MILPDSSQQDVDVQQVFHGNSLSACLRACALIDQSNIPTE